MCIFKSKKKRRRVFTAAEERHIEKVVLSCKTDKQKENAINWYTELMSKKY